MESELQNLLDKMYATKTGELLEVPITDNIKKDIEKLNALSKVLAVVGTQKIAELYKRARH